jgi:uncharacterized protein with PIN domain
MDYSIDLAVDISALVAVLFQEAEAEAVLQQLSVSGRIGISAANKTELLMVVGSRLGMAGRTSIFQLRKRSPPCGVELWRLLLLRLSETSASAVAVQGERFLEN